MIHPHHIVFSLLLCIGCNPVEPTKDYSAIYGNWYYFNFYFDSLESYNETYIDSSYISHHTYDMGTSGEYEYKVSADTLFYPGEENDWRPVGIFKKVSQDTIILHELNKDGQFYKQLTLLRIQEDSTFNRNMNYHPNEWQIEKSQQRVYFFLRANAAYFRAGFIKKEEYERMKTDTIQVFIN